MVWHSGPTARGSYVQTLVLTDIASGWTECAPLPVREQVLVTPIVALQAGRHSLGMPQSSNHLRELRRQGAIAKHGIVDILQA